MTELLYAVFYIVGICYPLAIIGFRYFAAKDIAPHVVVEKSEKWYINFLNLGVMCAVIFVFWPLVVSKSLQLHIK